MKLSVSVPDELWERAKGQRPDLGTSQLMQEALESWVKPADTAGFSLERPADAEEGFQVARQRLAEKAREEFENGYRAAVQTMPALSWWYVQRLAESKFDVKSWAEGIGQSQVEAQIGHVPKDWAPEDGVVGALIQGLGGWIMPYGDEAPRATIPFMRGFAKAFRELWVATIDGTSARSEASESSGNGEGALG